MPSLRPAVALAARLARAVILVTATLGAGACEGGPIGRGAGSEHRQAWRVGLPL